MAKDSNFDTMHPSDCWKGAFFYLESYRFLIEMGEGANQFSNHAFIQIRTHNRIFQSLLIR